MNTQLFRTNLFCEIKMWNKPVSKAGFYQFFSVVICHSNSKHIGINIMKFFPLRDSSVPFYHCLLSAGEGFCFVWRSFTESH